MTQTVTTRPPVAPNAGSSLASGSGRAAPPPWLRAEAVVAYVVIIAIWVVLEIAHAWRRLRLRMD